MLAKAPLEAIWSGFERGNFSLLHFFLFFCMMDSNVRSLLVLEMKGAWVQMTRIPEKDRDIMEKAFYLPMVLIVLNRDLTIIDRSPFKLKKPYIELIEETMKNVQGELAEVKRYMKLNKMQVVETDRDDAFTMYTFLYKGYEEHHNYFNPRIRNRVQELMACYFLKKHPSQDQNAASD